MEGGVVPSSLQQESFVSRWHTSRVVPSEYCRAASTGTRHSSSIHQTIVRLPSFNPTTLLRIKQVSFSCFLPKWTKKERQQKDKKNDPLTSLQSSQTWNKNWTKMETGTTQLRYEDECWARARELVSHRRKKWMTEMGWEWGGGGVGKLVKFKKSLRKK
jgi:hypothetical protein